MSAKNKLMLIQYCNIIIRGSLDPETPFWAPEMTQHLIFCIKLHIKAQKLV